MIEIIEAKWIIVSKDRKVIAKGVPRNRNLVSISDKQNTQRILTYKTKKVAENAFTTDFFYQSHKENTHYKKEDLEAIEAECSVREKEKK